MQLRDDKHTLRPFWIDALHIIALSALAVAQPIYEQIASGPEFLVAHRATSIHIIALVAVLSLGLPAVLIILEGISALFGRAFRRIIHLILIWMLLLAFSLQLVNRYFSTAALPIIFATVISFFLVALYNRSIILNRVVTIMFIGSLLFPLNFMLFTPVSKIVIGGKQDSAYVATSSTNIPVVLVVFDEFNPTALLNKNHELDQVRYPNFAQLAKSAWWFPRATSVHPQTLHAVPAILTGVIPKDETALPNYNDHPNNLFTLLGGAYSFNVSETLTKLCPNRYCFTEQATFKAEIFTSDVLVIYMHAIFPKSLAARYLPALNNGWEGFQAAPKQQSHDDQLNQYKIRLTKFRDFVANAGRGNRSLDFIHILLPHVPYVFLPNGDVYDGGLDGGWGESKPAEDQNSVNVAYQRFLLQAGMADTLLGELIKKLKDTGTYDDTLVVVTADHGKVFRLGAAARDLTNETPDVLHVPLFIKLPHQRSSSINRRLVSNVDILPTIADVVDIKIPWPIDGTSVFAPTDEASELAVVYNKHTLHIDRNKIVTSPDFDWQLRTFGSDTPLNQLKIIGPYTDLVGKSVRDVVILPSSNTNPPTLTTEIGQFSSVDLQSGYTPSLFQAEIVGAPPNYRGWIALSINDRFAVVAPSVSDAKGKSEILAMIPKSMLSNGDNQFAAYFIEGDHEKRRLREINFPRAEIFSLEKDDSGIEYIQSNGRQIPINSNQSGNIEQLTIQPGFLKLVGWAGDTQKDVPPRKLVVFVDGTFKFAFSPNIERPDVAHVFEGKQLVSSGFATNVPLKNREIATSIVRVFSVSPDGSASEIRHSEK